MEEQESVSIKKAIDDLLQTSIFKEIRKRNSQDFAERLASWIVRYILVVSSMKSSFATSLEETLFSLHGEKFKKILEITEQIFRNIHDDASNDTSYIR